MAKLSLPFQFSLHWGEPHHVPAEMAFYAGSHRHGPMPEGQWVNRMVVHPIAKLYGLSKGWDWFVGFHRFKNTHTRDQVGPHPADAGRSTLAQHEKPVGEEDGRRPGF